MLTDQRKERKICSGRAFLGRYQQDDWFFQRFLWSTRKWTFYTKAESKHQSMQWRHSSSPKPKTLSSLRTRLEKWHLLFFGTKRVPIGSTINTRGLDWRLELSVTSRSHFIKSFHEGVKIFYFKKKLRFEWWETNIDNT